MATSDSAGTIPVLKYPLDRKPRSSISSHSSVAKKLSPLGLLRMPIDGRTPVSAQRCRELGWCTDCSGRVVDDVQRLALGQCHVQHPQH